MVKTNKKSTKNQIISKDELISRIQEKSDVGTKSEVKKVVDSLLEVINEALIAGQEIRLVGHFNLRTDLKAKSKAMNLQTKQPIVVPAHYAPKCKFSNELKKRIKERKVK